jgi:hypothetical protein
MYLMTEDIDEEQNIERILGQVLCITKDQLRDYVYAKDCMRSCSACGSSNWIFPMIKGMPAIYSMPSVRHAEFAEWAFHLNCGNCGNTRHISAGVVWEHIFKIEVYPKYKLNHIKWCIGTAFAMAGLACATLFILITR